MKLSKFELEIVANAATDLLQEAHEAAYKDTKETNLYKNFATVYDDDVTQKLKLNDELVKDLEQQIRDIENVRNAYEKDTVEYLKENNLDNTKLGFSSWRSPSTEDYLAAYLNYKKTELYPDAEFNRSKVTNKVSMDILTSPYKTPAEFLDSIKSNIKSN